MQYTIKTAGLQSVAHYSISHFLSSSKKVPVFNFIFHYMTERFVNLLFTFIWTILNLYCPNIHKDYCILTCFKSFRLSFIITTDHSPTRKVMHFAEIHFAFYSIIRPIIGFISVVNQKTTFFLEFLFISDYRREADCVGR